MPDETLVYWSARASGVAFVVAVVLAGFWLRGAENAGQIRAAWTVGCALLVAHELLALGISFGWSQSLAWENIARQTRDATGVDFGGGLAINYATAAVWTADVVWWWWQPETHAARRPAITVVLWTYLAMMFFFGAVVFAEGATRTISAALAAIAGVWLVVSVAQRSARSAST